MRGWIALALLTAAPAAAQSDADKKRWAEEADTRMHQDWAWLAKYRDANKALAPAPKHPRIVFMGDSITEGWYDMVPGFFAGERVGRGIGGQTTPQMLVRFRQDVIALKPAVVQIMAGTNDIAGNTGPITPEETQANIMSMAELARAHGLRVILASVPPADRFPWRAGLATAPKIAALNAWMKAYAARTGSIYADYWTALHDGDALRASLTYDGVHPNRAGYEAMAPVAEAAIRQALAQPASTQAGPVVATNSGPVRGQLLEQGAVFRGIRFARPPVGALRWRPPEPPRPWRAPADAVAEHAACPQPVYGDWNRAAADNDSEDCLFLDVRTPTLAKGAKLPVMIWIHGGGNRAGSGSGTVESSITNNGIVLVSIQYRLGALGFLSHPVLTAEQGTSGNYGLQDQQLALRWVRDNIANFGGNPGRITIAGESAGAQDVALHQLAPASRGLFAGAIQESGTAGFGVRPRSLAENERLGTLIAAKAGLPETVTGAQLRALPAEAIVAAQEAVDVPDLDDDSFIWLQAVVDGRVLPDTPARLLAAGRVNRVPLVIGVNARELTLHGGLPAARATVIREFGADAARALSLYGLGPGQTPVDDPRLGDVTLQLANDLTFRCPAMAVTDLLVRHGGAVWQYQFDYNRPDGSPVSHASEVRYVFDAVRGGPPLQAYWTYFVKTGDPNGGQLPQWPRYNPTRRPYLSFSNTGPVAAAALRRDICSLRGVP